MQIHKKYQALHIIVIFHREISGEKQILARYCCQWVHHIFDCFVSDAIIITWFI